MKYIEVSKLEIYEDNPRHINQKDFDVLVESMKNDPKFFNARPCLVNHITEDKKLIVYAGAQRLRAAIKLGYTEVPCNVENNVSIETMRNRCLLDNHHVGQWDFDTLANDWDISELELLGEKFLKDLRIPNLNEFIENDTEIEQESELVDEKLPKETNYVVKYEIIFDDEQQQSIWYKFLLHLKNEYLGETLAEKLTLYLNQNVFNGQD
jgi:hypothetical protein